MILSTHIVQDLRELCTRMAIMDKGRVLYEGTTDDALALISGKVFEKQVDKENLEAFRSEYSVLTSKMVGGEHPGFTCWPTKIPATAFLPLPNLSRMSISPNSTTSSKRGQGYVDFYSIRALFLAAPAHALGVPRTGQRDGGRIVSV